MSTKKIALIAGGTSGVGKRTAIDLAKRDFQIILIGRDVNKGEQVKKEIFAQTNNKDILFYPVAFVNEFKTTFDHIDVLISTVGVMFPDLRLTKDGYDQNFVLNYLMHFWLIRELLPLLKKSLEGRILMVGALPSAVNRTSVKLPIIESFNKEKYNAFTPVNEALVGRVLLTLELSEILKGTNVTANSFHSGYVTDSNYGAESNILVKALGKLLGIFSKKNVPIGAELATDNGISTDSGKFFNGKKEIVPLTSRYTMELAQKLWDMSEKL